MSSATETRIKDLLAPLTSGLEADGYVLEVAVRPGVIALDVVAGPEACEDCLVPRTMMEEMFRVRLTPGETGLDHQNVSLTYPANAEMKPPA